MNWTNALAIFGAVTGASGLGWQMWSHRLTGGRVEVLDVISLGQSAVAYEGRGDGGEG